MLTWVNKKNEQCRFFINSKTNHYILTIGKFYYEYNRFNRDQLISSEELEHYSIINDDNVSEHIDFLKELSDKVTYIKPINNTVLNPKVKNEHVIRVINNCKIIY